MTKVLYIVGEVHRIPDHEGEYHALRIVTELERDPALRQALARQAGQDHRASLAARGQLPAGEWGMWELVRLNKRMAALEDRIIPLMEQLTLSPEERARDGWLARLQGECEPVPETSQRDLDAEACRVLHDIWLDTARWRANRVGGVPDAPPPPYPTLRQKAVRWWQDLGGRLP